MSEVGRNHTAGSQGSLIYDCPNGEVCRSCPCSHEDDVCFPGERLRAEVERLGFNCDSLRLERDGSEHQRRRDNEYLLGEIDRLRSALDAIAQLSLPYRDTANRARHIATRALVSSSDALKGKQG